MGFEPGLSRLRVGQSTDLPRSTSPGLYFQATRLESQEKIHLYFHSHKIPLPCSHRRPLWQIIIARLERPRQGRTSPGKVFIVYRLPARQVPRPPTERSDRRNRVIAFRQRAKIEGGAIIGERRINNKMRARQNIFLAPQNIVGADNKYDVVVFRREILHRRLYVFGISDGVSLVFVARPYVVGTSHVNTCDRRRDDEIMA